MLNKKDEKQFYSKVNSGDSSFLSLLTVNLVEVC